MNRLTLSIGVLFVLVLAIYLPGWMSDAPQTPLNEQEEAWQPNYQARNMRSTLYDESGNVNHQVYANRMEHYQLLGFTLFRQPQYTIYVKSQAQPWQVIAAEGTLYEDNRIQLETDVEIRSLNEQGHVQTIRTNYIEINLTNKTMMSDQPVEIIGQDYVINSNGFTADLETQQYELIDHVQTRYAPR